MRGVLRQKSSSKWTLSKLSASSGTENGEQSQKKMRIASSTITQAWFWPRVWGNFLKENDIVITETGHLEFSVSGKQSFPKGVTALSQVLWGSIGYFKLVLARELHLRRGTLDQNAELYFFVGDGSLQLTAQENWYDSPL